MLYPLLHQVFSRTLFPFKDRIWIFQSFELLLILEIQALYQRQISSKGSLWEECYLQKFKGSRSAILINSIA
jgi:hypothetical protein